MSSTTCTIFDLDEKCLGNILPYLSVSERLKLALVDLRFSTAIATSIANALVDLTQMQELLPPLEARRILANCGKHIQRIKLEASVDSFDANRFNNIVIYLENLTEINLHGFEITSTNAYGKLFGISKEARIIRLRRCVIDNSACLILSELQNLQVLDLEQCKLTGKHLYKLTNLRHLNLRNCRNFKSKNFIQLCRSIKLKTLNIAHCKQLSNVAFQALIETQAAIEAITVGNQYWSKDFHAVCHLVNLREFAMRYCEERQIACYLNELALKHRDTLQSLDIHFSCDYPCETVNFLQAEICDRIGQFRNLKSLCLPYCSLLENTDLMRIVKACPDLEMIDIGGSTFTDNGVVGCVENLMRLQFLDISYCNVERSLYHLLVEIRQELRCEEVLTIFVKEKTAMGSWLNTEFHDLNKSFVRLSLDSMRSPKGICLLDQLDHLKKTNQQKRKNHHQSLPKQSAAIEFHPTLSDLDDDCLHHIMSFLDLTEKLTLVLSTDRFDDIFRHFLQRILFNMPEMLTNFTVREVRKILERFGAAIRRLCLEPAHNHFDIDYHRLAANYCTNLFELQCKSVESETTKGIISTARNIRTLKLISCDLDDALWGIHTKKLRKIIN